MLYITDFKTVHIENAVFIAKQNYNIERSNVPALPDAEIFPSLAPYVENNLGVAAYEDNKMVGFLCSVSPFKNAFGSTDAVGVFSPMHANGAVLENRASIYARMYQEAAKKWAAAKASSHAICLYAHDEKSQYQFFRYGFGLRCIDAIRFMDEIEVPVCPDYEFVELNANEYINILPLDYKLDAHMASSPTFILRPSDTEENFLKNIERSKSRYFAAKINNTIAAFIKIGSNGETFICSAKGMKNICGAFCLPEHRGKGVYQNLINYLIRTLKAEGFTHLGVDFESINPTANNFWLKYFTPYTHSVVRRIDEHSL